MGHVYGKSTWILLGQELRLYSWHLQLNDLADFGYDDFLLLLSYSNRCQGPCTTKNTLLDIDTRDQCTLFQWW